MQLSLPNRNGIWKRPALERWAILMLRDRRGIEAFTGKTNGT
jgi:hypothetical protein